MSMIDWSTYRQQLAEMVTEIARTSPDIARGYRTLAQAHSAGSTLDPKTRELIALAVAVTLRCDGCITNHVEAAKKSGATEAEVTDALGVAISVNAGAAQMYSARTIDAFKAPDVPKQG